MTKIAPQMAKIAPRMAEFSPWDGRIFATG
jgi:hypothetical protein